MEKEEKLKKWLRGELSDKELEDFEQSNEFRLINKIDRSLQQFKAPEYFRDTSFIDIADKKLRVKRFRKRVGLYLSSAAIIVAILSIAFFLFVNHETSQVVNDSSSQKSIYLPDSSFVNLNAKSSLSYNPNTWEEKKLVKMIGEAFFSVKKAGKFQVETATGTVSVLGTKFNVIARDSYFEVACYEGKVSVSAAGSQTILNPGETVRVISEKFVEKANLSLRQKSPSWLVGETSFKSLPTRFVLEEFERQYDVVLKSKNIDTNQVISGSFVHGDIEIALESISIPLNCTYKIAEDQITLFSKNTH